MFAGGAVAVSLHEMLFPRKGEKRERKGAALPPQTDLHKQWRQSQIKLVAFDVPPRLLMVAKSQPPPKYLQKHSHRQCINIADA